MGNEGLLIARTRIVKFYKTYERWFTALTKYLSVVWILAMISNAIGYVEILGKSYMILGIALISMILPVHIILLMMMTIVAIHLMGFNLLLGGMAAISFVILYFMYIRLYPKESLLIIITMVAFLFRCEYMIPLIAALFGGYACSVAIGIGVVGHYAGEALHLLIQNNALQEGLIELTQQLVEVFIRSVLINRNMLGTIVIFTCVFAITYFIRKQSIDYAPYIAVAVGTVMHVLGFGLAVLFLKIDVQFGWLFGMTLVGAVGAVIAQMFAYPLDYSRTEVVQFEDDENVYYVKVVPKLALHSEPKKVEQIYTMNKQDEKEVL